MRPEPVSKPRAALPLSTPFTYQSRAAWVVLLMVAVNNCLPPCAILAPANGVFHAAGKHDRSVILSAFAVMPSPLAVILSSFAVMLGPFAVILSAFAVMLGPFAVILSAFAVMLGPFAVMLSAFAVILSEAKNPALPLRVNFSKHLALVRSFQAKTKGQTLRRVYPETAGQSEILRFAQNDSEGLRMTCSKRVRRTPGPSGRIISSKRLPRNSIPRAAAAIVEKSRSLNLRSRVARRVIIIQVGR